MAMTDTTFLRQDSCACRGRCAAQRLKGCQGGALVALVDVPQQLGEVGLRVLVPHRLEAPQLPEGGDVPVPHLRRRQRRHRRAPTLGRPARQRQTRARLEDVGLGGQPKGQVLQLRDAVRQPHGQLVVQELGGHEQLPLQVAHGAKAQHVFQADARLALDGAGEDVVRNLGAAQGLGRGWAGAGEAPSAPGGAVPPPWAQHPPGGQSWCSAARRRRPACWPRLPC